MQQGVDKQINLGGIVRNTAGSTCPDGEMEEIINLRYKDGSLRPISDNKTLPGLENVDIDYTHIYIHNNAYQHFIGVLNKNELYYFADMDDDGLVTMLKEPNLLINISYDDEIQVQYSQTGNLLTVIDATGIHYLYFRNINGDKKYVSLPTDYNGTKTDSEVPPEYCIDFRIANKKFNGTNSPMVRAIPTDTKWYTSRQDKKKSQEGCELRKSVAPAQMIVSRGISTKHNEPTGYFFVCTAIKLYDGTFILQSRPVLIMPPNVTSFAKRDNEAHNTVRFTSEERFGTKKYVEDEKTIYEFPLYVEKSAKSTRLQPYKNSENYSLFRMSNHGREKIFCGDMRIGPKGNIFKLGAAKETHGEPCWCYMNQKLYGINYIPDLTCLYGTNLFAKNHGGFTNIPTQSGSYRTPYFLKCYYSNSEIDNSDASNINLKRNPTTQKELKEEGGLDGWDGKSTEHYNWYRKGENWRFTVANNFMSEELIMPAITAESKDTAEESNDHSTPLYCFNMPHELQMNIHSGIDKSYEDIIESVCVFMTTQVEPLEINNKNIADYIKAHYIYPASVTYRGNDSLYLHHIGKDDWNLVCENLNDLEALRLMGEEYYVRERKKDDVREELEGIKNFYLLSEMKFADYNENVGKWISVPIEDGVLENLTSQKELNLDSADRRSYCPQTSLMYNGRLHYANYKRSMFLGYPLKYFWNNQISNVGAKSYVGNTAINQHTQGIASLLSWYSAGGANGESIADFMRANRYPAYCIAVELETSEGTRRVARYSYYKKDGESLTVYNLNPFISYPDNRAKKITIITQGIEYRDSGKPVLCKKKKELPLTSHKTFELSYYIDENLQPITSYEECRHQGSLIEVTADNIKDLIKEYFVSLDYLGLTDDNLLEEEVPNGLRVSAVNNPIYFPYANTYQVGNMQIIGLATNAIAAGDGQTGDMPLYVFSNDGVYGLFVDATGITTYSNSRPISRDVCNNRRSITYTSQGIAFSAHNGIKLLSGGQTSDVTDPIEGDYLKFTNKDSNDYIQVASQAISNDKLVQLADYVTNIDFLEYARLGCIIGYNYYENELYITNPSKNDNGEYIYPYSYIISERTGAIIKRSLVVEQYIQNYPETYILSGHRLKILGKYDDAKKGIQSMFLTRPIKFDSQAFKQGYRSIIRGLFNVVEYPTAACDVKEFTSENLAPLLRKITIIDPNESVITIDPISQELTKVEINTPTTHILTPTPDESTYERIEYRSETVKDLTPMILAKTLRVIDVVANSILLTNDTSGTFALTNALQGGTFNVYSVDESISEYNGRFVATSDCVITLEQLQNELEYLFSEESEPHSVSEHIRQYSEDMSIEDCITIDVERGNYIDSMFNTGVISLDDSITLLLSAYNTQGGIVEAANAAGIGVRCIGTNNCYSAAIDSAETPFDSLLQQWVENKSQFNIVLQREFLTDFEANIGTRYILIDRSFSNYDTFAVYVQNGFYQNGEGIEQPSTEDITLSANVGYIVLDKDDSEYRVSPTTEDRTMAYNVLLSDAKNGLLINENSLDGSVSLINGNLYSVYYEHKQITEVEKDEDTPQIANKYDTFIITTTHATGLFVIVWRDLLDILDRLEEEGGEFTETIDGGADVNIHFASKDNELLYSPSKIEAEPGTKMYVINNTSTDSYGNAKTYSIECDDSSIATFEFLQKCLLGSYKTIQTTTFDSDIIPIPTETNITLIDNIIGKTYHFYNWTTTNKYNYNTLTALLADGGYFDEPYSINNIAIAITNGAFVQVVYKEQEYKIQYTGNSFINLGTLLENCSNGVYQPAPVVDPNKLITLTIGRYTRLITPDKQYDFIINDFIIKKLDTTRAVHLKPIRPKIGVTEFNYSALISVLDNRKDTVKNTKGKEYDIEYIDDLDERLSNLRAGIYLFGSYDCKRWQYIGGNEISGSFRDLGALTERLDCKYFRICFVGNLLPDSSIEYIDMSVESRLLQGKLR